MVGGRNKINQYDKKTCVRDWNVVRWVSNEQPYTMKKKQMPPDLYAEAVAVLQRSETLKQTVYWQNERVDKLVNKYTEEEFDALPWELKESHLKECDEIWGRLNQSVKELKDLDDAYNSLRSQVKDQMGEDILPPISGDIRGLIGPDDEVSLV